MASKYENQPTITVKPGHKTRALLDEWVAKWQTNRSRMASLMIDFVGNEMPDEFEEFCKKNYRYLNILMDGEQLEPSNEREE